MKILYSVTDLKNEFIRLLENYNEYYWAVAWAGIDFDVFEMLKNKKDRIKEIIVGLHFYQTHPEFIKEYLSENSVKYIIQTNGTFHPKAYLFQNNNVEWEILIGSPNFTKAAFSLNSEISVLISSNDNNNEKIYLDIKSYINEFWNKGEYFDSIKLENYKNSWVTQKPKIGSLAGTYGGKIKSKKIKLLFETETQKLNWQEYLNKINGEINHYVNDRIKVIKIASDLFRKYNKFSEMNTEERKFIAGIPNKLEIDGAENGAFFGSMKARGYFKQRIIENDEIISLALDQIPLIGKITKQHYLNFWECFKQFSGTELAAATRLLCMKRPDTFICFTSKNKDNLCKDFGIEKIKFDIDSYWDEIIERIFDSNWWQNPKPNSSNENEIIISNARAAFLDSLLYVGDYNFI